MILKITDSTRQNVCHLLIVAPCLLIIPRHCLKLTTVLSNELPIRFDIMAFALDNQKCVTVLIEPLSVYHSAKLFSVCLVY